MTIPLYEDFADQFLHYDTYVPVQTAALPFQRHTDIRSFIQSPLTEPLTMLAMTRLTEATLATFTMSELSVATTLRAGEAWTAGTVSAIVGLSHFPGLQFTCTNGLNTTASVMTTTPVDIGGFGGSDYISIALPAFPTAKLDLTNTFLDLTSDPTGTFPAGATDSLAFSLATLVTRSPNVEARWPIASLTHINRTSVIGVRFRITAIAACVFQCLAIRALASTWQYSVVDTNTLYKRLERTVPPTGDLTQPYTFPTAANPLVFFSDGGSGPKVVDSKIGFVVSTGSGNFFNHFSLYLREDAFIAETLGQVSTQTMAQLATAPQPNTTPAQVDDLTNTHDIVVTLMWTQSGPSAVTVTIDNTVLFSGTTFALAAQTDYYVLVTLVTNTLQIQIFPIASNGVITLTPVYDSTPITDWANFPRRAGRIGWQAFLQDGDSYVSALRPITLVYGEYRSTPYYSDTPVEGAQVFASTTGLRNLFSGVSAYNGATVRPDNTKSSSGDCLRVAGNGPSSGVLSDPIRFENFAETVIAFDLFVPTGISIEALLIGEGRLISLNVPPTTANQWTQYSLPLDALQGVYQPGPYGLLIFQRENLTQSWYIDNLIIYSRSISWAGHAITDPWGVNDSPWVPFGDTVNTLYDGAQFTRGNSLQIRGQAVAQDATIEEVKIIPKYAELGNLVWPHGGTINTFALPPTAIDLSILIGFDGGATYTFTAIWQTADSTLTITSYAWDFGDGTTGTGQTPTHTYTLGPGQALPIARLTATDSHGNNWYAWAAPSLAT